MRYSSPVIRSFQHSGLKSFFQTGSKAGIQPAHSKRLAIQLVALDAARDVQEMNVPGWSLHPLKGELKGHWSVRVNGNWRMTFRFEGSDAYVVNYQDYH